MIISNHINNRQLLHTDYNLVFYQHNISFSCIIILKEKEKRKLALYSLACRYQLWAYLILLWLSFSYIVFNGDVGNVKTWMYLPYQVATCRECNKRCCSYWSMERERAQKFQIKDKSLLVISLAFLLCINSWVQQTLNQLPLSVVRCFALIGQEKEIVLHQLIVVRLLFLISCHTKHRLGNNDSNSNIRYSNSV